MSSAKIGVKTSGRGTKVSMVSNSDLKEMLENKNTRNRDKPTIKRELFKRMTLN